MNKNRPKKRKNHVKVCVHTSTFLTSLSIPEMQQLVYNSLRDAFLPPLLHVSETPEKADQRYQETLLDPYWQEKYSNRSVAEIWHRYRGVLPITSQYQLDSSTFVSCLKDGQTFDTGVTLLRGLWSILERFYLKF